MSDAAGLVEPFGDLDAQAREAHRRSLRAEHDRAPPDHALERDLGPTVQIASGLCGTERVVQIASADLAKGERVEVAK